MAQIVRSNMWEVSAIVLIAAGIFLWLDSLRARERAVQAGRRACERYELQFLDDTVSFTRIRLKRDEDGQLRIARTYTFEFSDTGNNRRHGAIVMLGGELQVLQLAAEHHDGAVAAVVAGVGKLERIRARDPELSVLVAPESDARERNRIIQKLQVVALARPAPGLHRALARSQAVEPEKNPCCDKNNRADFPHV